MNLHLMPVYSHLSHDLIDVLNSSFPKEDNLFIVREPFPKMHEYDNCIADSSCFSVSFINAHAVEYRRIFLHYNFLKPHQIMRLTDEAAKKIVWVVWGDDLYYVKHRYEPPRSLFGLARSAFYIWSHYSLLYGIIRQKAKRKVQQFFAVGIGYSYDEVIIHKLFGKEVRVMLAPVVTRNRLQYTYDDVREEHASKHTDVINVLIGHSGFCFHNHEQSIRLLSKFKKENIHINMVLSYGASTRRVSKLSNLAIRTFGIEKVSILTEVLPYTEYCRFLASMDIAVFPFAHQAALGNAKMLAYAGIKLYLDPKGALSQGFLAGGVKTYDYHHIKQETWSEFCLPAELPEKNASLFSRSYEDNITAWAKLLESES